MTVEECKRIPLQSCAAAGAVQACSSVTDAITLVHGPTSCAHIMSSAKDILDAGRIGNVEPMIPQSWRIRSTDMDDESAIFGGADKLESCIRGIIDEGHRRIYVVTTCMPGIIGDDAGAVIARVCRELPDVSISLIDAVGNMTGDFDSGYLNAACKMLEEAEGDTVSIPGHVNLIAERYFFKSGRFDDGSAARVLSQFGLQVDCRFLYASDSDSILGMRSAELNLIVSDDPVSRMISKHMVEKGFPVWNTSLPTSPSEYTKFALELGRFTGRDYSAVAEDVGKMYHECTSRIKPILHGRRVLIVDKFIHDIDWLIELVADLGMDLLRIGIGPSNPSRPSTHLENDVMLVDYDIQKLMQDVRQMEPDLIIIDSDLIHLDSVRTLKFGRQMPGIDHLTEYAERMRDAMIAPAEEGWRIPS